MFEHNPLLRDGKWDYYATFRGQTFSVANTIWFQPDDMNGLLDETMNLLREIESPVVVDVGAGAGNIALAVINEVPGAFVYAVEPDETAFRSLTINARELSPEGAVELLKTTIDKVELEPESVDAFVGSVPNYPYKDDDYKWATAAYAGVDGLDVIRDMISVAEDALKPGGFIVFVRVPQEGDNPQSWFDSTKWTNIIVEPEYIVRAFKKPLDKS